MTDPLCLPSDPDTHWSTVNVGEALPGVATPLGWSLWGTVGDRMCRDLCYAIGVFNRRERADPARPGDRIVSIFRGRIAMRMEWLAVVGDRMPGTTGADAVAGMLGKAPDTMVFAPTRRRYPVIAWRLPSAGLGTPGRIRRTAPATERWWRRRTRELATADRDRAVAVFAEAVRQFGHTMTLHGIGLFSAVTPLFNALTALVAKAGVGDVAVLSGTGGAEMAMIESIWRASRGEIGVQQVIDEHGYHGPLEGEVSSRVWREDPAPLHAMIEHYRARGESDSPLRRDRLAAERLPVMQRQVLAALPAARRPAARLLLVAAARTIPLRGVGKASFLQALDVIRAAARRIGEHLEAEGVLDDPEDVFYLLAEELTGPALVDARALVAARRAWRAEHLRVELPQSWRGVPEPLPAEPAGSDKDRAGSSVTGIGAGPGVVEGLARVVTDPRFVDVEPGEVLIAPTTDPSWASIMFVSAALVVDIGSMISHAAVVARELGLPCVVNTRTGTRVFRDGDLVRVDGAAGTVELVKPVERPGPGT